MVEKKTRKKKRKMA